MPKQQQPKSVTAALVVIHPKGPKFEIQLSNAHIFLKPNWYLLTPLGSLFIILFFVVRFLKENDLSATYLLGLVAAFANGERPKEAR